MQERQLLRRRSAEREADDVGSLDLARVEDAQRVAGELGGRVRARGGVALADTARIRRDAAVGAREVGELRRPGSGRSVQSLQPEHGGSVGGVGTLVDHVQPRPVLRDDLYAPSSSRTWERRCWSASSIASNRTPTSYLAGLPEGSSCTHTTTALVASVVSSGRNRSSSRREPTLSWSSL